MVNHPHRARGRAATSAAPASRATRTVRDHDDDYAALLETHKGSFAVYAAGFKRLFRTDAKNLYETYLRNIPAAERQVHACHACKRFIETYGALVAINDAGQSIPVMWNPDVAPVFYKPAFKAMRDRVMRARIVSPFLTKEHIWGTPLTGNWSHFSVTPASGMAYIERALTAGQAMAAAKENFRTVSTALAEFTPAGLDQAIRLLESEKLARSEKFIGPVKWLRDLHDRPKGKLGENLLWKAIASAPEGFCHPKASVVGPLLDDIAAGLSFSEIKVRFNAKLSPLQYQRPQAAPAAGNIAAAEALVAKLGIERSLERRFARLDELREHIVWAPHYPVAASKAPNRPGVFSHLQPSPVPRPIALPSSTLTWEKFSRVVLPQAERLEIRVPTSGRFLALTTAVHEDAPPILKWDREGERNPVAWYVYPHGSSASQWGLHANHWHIVDAVVPLPTMWGADPVPHLFDGVVLVIKGAKDSVNPGGNAIFPETLGSHLHSVRSTIEAFSRKATLHGRAQASACGYDIRKAAADCTLRTFSAGAWTEYRIDRWD